MRTYVSGSTYYKYSQVSQEISSSRVFIPPDITVSQITFTPNRHKDHKLILWLILNGKTFAFSTLDKPEFPDSGRVDRLNAILLNDFFLIYAEFILFVVNSCSELE